MLDTIINKTTPSNFYLTLPLIPGQIDISDNNELILNIHQTVIPGISSEIQISNWQGAKVPFAAGSTTFTEWQFTFILDENFLNWKILHNWILIINNNKDKFLEYYNDYVVDSTLNVLDNFEKSIFSIKIINMWPTDLSPVELSYREGENILECNATFAYMYYEIQK